MVKVPIGTQSASAAKFATNQKERESFLLVTSEAALHGTSLERGQCVGIAIDPEDREECDEELQMPLLPARGVLGGLLPAVLPADVLRRLKPDQVGLGVVLTHCCFALYLGLLLSEYDWLSVTQRFELLRTLWQPLHRC